jgi:hypothetical protein
MSSNTSALAQRHTLSPRQNSFGPNPLDSNLLTTRCTSALLRPSYVSASLVGRHDDNPCDGKVTLPPARLVLSDRGLRQKLSRRPLRRREHAVKPFKPLPRTNSSLPVVLKRYLRRFCILSESGQYLHCE